MELNQSLAHPLMQYPILNKIINYSSFVDLLSMRQTCKIWNTQVNTFIRFKIQVHIIGNENLNQFNQLIGNSFQSFQCHIFKIQHISLILEKQVFGTGNLFNNFGLKINSLHLNTNWCLHPYLDLKQLLFEYLPNLKILTLEQEEVTEKNIPNRNPNRTSSQILPMKFGHDSENHRRLTALKSFQTIGDFCRQSDIIYDVMKYSPNLKCVKIDKQHTSDDDLYGIWLFEIITSPNLNFNALECLEIDFAIHESQLKFLTETNIENGEQNFPVLKRLCLNLSGIEMRKLEIILIPLLRKYQITLESAEFVIDCESINSNNVSNEEICSMYQKLIRQYKFWIAFHGKNIHRGSTSKLLFTNHCYEVILK